MRIKSTRAREVIAAFILYVVLGAILSAFMLMDGESFAYAMVIYHISLLSTIVFWFLIYWLCDWVYGK